MPIPAYIFPDTSLHTSLLSISELCNAGCLATFDANSFHLTYNDLPVIQGFKHANDKLWSVSLPSNTCNNNSNPQCNAAQLSSDASFVSFVHTSLGNPVFSTFIHAIRAGYLNSWPRLSTAIVLAHPPHTIATAKGHLNQHRQGMDSTKTDSSILAVPSPGSDSTNPDIVEAQSSLTPETSNHAYVKILQIPHTVSADLTGKFPVTADSGAQYVLISEMDGYIHAEPMSSRHHTAYITSFSKTIEFFTAIGRQPLFLRLDNETSAPLDAFMSRHHIRIQYCPPGTHRANRAERSIQTFKNHAIATLCTTSKDFPLTLWDKLLPQIELCLNHLHPYKPNPLISAYAGLHGGAHDFRAHPIAPAGCKVLIHDKPGARGSWAPHGVPGFYLGPALRHYRSYHVWATSTQALRITDTVAWFLDNIKPPLPSPHDLLLAAIHDLTSAVTQITKTHPTLLHSGQISTLPSITSQLLDIADMYASPHSPKVSIPAVDSQANPKAALEERVLLPPVPSVDSSPPPVDALHTTSQEQRVCLPPNSSNEPASALPPHDPLPHNIPITIDIARIPTTPAPPPGRITRQTAAHRRAIAYAALNLAPDGSPLTYSKAKAGPDAAFWLQAESEEFDRLLQSQTIRPIHHHQQASDRRKDTTYFNPQTKQKINSDGATTYRIRGTAGGDRINYNGPTSAQTAAMSTVKIFLHSVVSEEKQWMTIDIKDYYLGTPLTRPEYIRIPIRMIPHTTMDTHILRPYIDHQSILFEVTKGMYGLPQAGLLAQQRLIAHLAIHGYHETRTPCLFRHISNGTDFTLVVDDFGIKYSTKEGAQHLIDTLSLLYIIKVDWTGSTYIGFTIKFNVPNHTVSLTMPGYIAKVLQRFAVPISLGASSPATYNPPSYGSRDHKVTIDQTPPLSPTDIKTLQEQVGCLLYYARGVDPTILPAVNHIASLQSIPTASVKAAMDRLLQYCARFPDNALVFTACDMTLFIQSDASYLSRPQARSVAGGVFYLGNSQNPTNINGPCLALSTIIPVVVSSVAEAEYAAVFMNAREGSALRTILDSIGYPQPTTEILCDNMCAVGLASDTIAPKQTKSINMQFHWIRDRVKQQEFQVTWRKGANNLADFFTKALPVNVHKSIMPLLVHVPNSPNTSHQSAHARRSALWRLRRLDANHTPLSV